MTLPPENPGSDDVRNSIGDVDPLKWLESLAARQGANPEEFVTSADLDVPEVAGDTLVDEPGYQDYDPYGSADKPATPKHARPQAPPPAAEQPTPAQAAPAGEEEMNPLAWLESLARRQGANPEEFVTKADLEVEMVDPDTVIDEPGYTPYEGAAPAARSRPAPEPVQEPEEFAPEEEILPAEGALSPAEAAALLGLETVDMAPSLPAVEEVAPVAAAAAVSAAASVADDEDEVDPLAWLESLARRQGARSEELITGGTLDVPEAEAGALVDEPGYEDYSPFGTLADRADEEEDEIPEPESLEFASTGDDTLAWLEGLAADQGAAGAAGAAGADPLAGLTDEEIEMRAAAGELSAEQMEAWLRRQAASLADVHFDDDDAMLDELEPALPAEMPDWLQEAAPESDSGLPMPEVEEFAPEEAELELEPAEMPDWLQEPAAEEVPAAAGLGAAEPPVDYEDSWAQALDSEYMSTQQLASDEDPDWYQAALQDPSREAELEAELAAFGLDGDDFELDEEPLPEPEAAELPGWLQDAAPDEAAEDIPDWLTEEVPGSELSAAELEDLLGGEAEIELEAADMPDWLDEVEEEAEPAALPGWLREAAPDEILAEVEAEPAPAPAAPVPAAPAPVAPAQPRPAGFRRLLTPEIPVGAAYDTFRRALADNPQDHAARLSLARKLVADRRLADSLAQYEALVFAETELDTVQADVAQVIQQQPALPQARRILGDVLMRKGQLKEALETYRAALEQL
ncbi:MAG: hypothetical protein JXN59_02840 [Anaerolineae bacterium]|nr:hypothetical protein [Anaerolineae bacterium]